MQNTVLSENGVFEPGVFEPGVFEPGVLHPDTAPSAQPLPSRPAALGRKKLVRTLLLKWDMIAVIVLMLASAAYGIYALFFLTGF